MRVPQSQLIDGMDAADSGVNDARMASIVLVHGAFGGAWEWRFVARLLRGHGHEVHAVTLTGLGDRAHLGGPSVDLDTHVADVLAVLEMEDLVEVILCGHSYGGIVVTQASAIRGERLAATLYLDGFVPRVGESLLDLLPDELAALMRPQPADGWAVPCPFSYADADLNTPGLARWYNARSRPQPIGTFAQPVSATPADGYPRGYVRFLAQATAHQESFLHTSFERATSSRWWTRDIEGIHDCQVSAPGVVSAAIEDFVETR